MTMGNCRSRWNAIPWIYMVAFLPVLSSSDVAQITLLCHANCTLEVVQDLRLNGFYLIFQDEVQSQIYWLKEGKIVYIAQLYREVIEQDAHKEPKQIDR